MKKDMPAGNFEIDKASTNYGLIKQLINSVGLSKKVTILEEMDNRKYCQIKSQIL